MGPRGHSRIQTPHRAEKGTSFLHTLLRHPAPHPAGHLLHHPPLSFLLSFLLSFSPSCHLQPLPSLTPSLSSGASPLTASACADPPLAEPPGLVFAECGECRITQATSATRREEDAAEMCRAVPGPYLAWELCPYFHLSLLHWYLLPCQAPPGSGALASGPSWLPRALCSPVSACSSLCLKGSLILVMEPGYQPEGQAVWEAEAREANWGVAPPPIWGS